MRFSGTSWERAVFAHQERPVFCAWIGMTVHCSAGRTLSSLLGRLFGRFLFLRTKCSVYGLWLRFVRCGVGFVVLLLTALHARSSAQCTSLHWEEPLWARVSTLTATTPSRVCSSSEMQ